MSLPPAVETLNSLTAKLEWAEEHIHNLQAAWVRFCDGGAYQVMFKDDPKSGDRTYYLASAKEIRKNIRLLTGDAIHNLRSVLDHLAYAMVMASTISRPRKVRIYFPVASDATEYKASRKGIEKLVRQEIVEAIDEIEPYGGGKGEILWHLHWLDIVDKHRLLITVGSTNRQHTMPPSQRNDMIRGFLDAGELSPNVVPTRDFLIRPTNIIFPLKAGDKLGTVSKHEVDENMYFRFEVAFGEPKALKGNSVIETLHQIAQRITTTVYEFYELGFLD